MIRLLSQSLGGEAYLNFMGNEFGHPEWIDFPREGNGESYQHCRRQWKLAYDTTCRYEQLRQFDIVMNQTENIFKSMISKHQFVSLAHEQDKVIVYEKGDLLFVFNWNGNRSHENYAVGTKWKSDHYIVYESDAEEFGGFKRLDDGKGRWFETLEESTNERPYTLKLYIPTRTCIVLCAYERCVKHMTRLTQKSFTDMARASMPAVTDRQRK